MGVHHHHGAAHGSGARSHHGHDQPARSQPATAAPFALGAALNIGFVAVEAAYGIASNSTALLADAGHNLADVLALLTAWGANFLSRRRPSERYTYGLGSSSMLAALLNAVVLVMITGAVAGQAVQRLVSPEPVVAGVVMAVAACGILLNGATAMLFASSRKSDLNARGAFLHMAADALVSAGVVAAGGLTLLTGWAWIDPATSLLVSAVIVAGAWGLLKESVSMVLHGVPRGIEPAAVRAFLEDLPGVARVLDLHIWSMSTTETALTCRMLTPAGYPGDAFLAEVGHALSDRFRIGHATIQVELSAGPPCSLAG